MRSEEHEAPKRIPRDPAHAGARAGGPGPSVRVAGLLGTRCSDSAPPGGGAAGPHARLSRRPLSHRKGGRGSRPAKLRPELGRRLGVLPRRAAQGFGEQKGEIWAQTRLLTVV